MIYNNIITTISLIDCVLITPMHRIHKYKSTKRPNIDINLVIKFIIIYYINCGETNKDINYNIIDTYTCLKSIEYYTINILIIADSSVYEQNLYIIFFYIGNVSNE